MGTPNYNELIIRERFNYKTTRTLSEEFTSDKNRIIFSSPFRRLQQKAQVFSLETNAAVRSRLTHTLEVATIGISLAEKIADKLVENNLITQDLVLPFIKIIENACLIHDIGNPPFGHFAENAIKEWFKKNWKKLFFKASKLNKSDLQEAPINKELILDFLHFDGNPQGLRIVCTLQDVPGNFINFGLNLTYSQIASIVKYSGSTSNVDPKNPLNKKAGYFFSEKEKIDKIKRTLNFTNRYPLTYIMEAADDISYCLSDIEDGFEKKILTPQYFFEKLKVEWEKYSDQPHTYDSYFAGKNKADFFKFKIEFTRALIEHAIETYIEKHDEVINGSLHELIDKSTDGGLLLKCLKTVSRKYLFRSSDAENNELAGHEIILGILNKYGALLKLEYTKFYDLVSSKDDLDKVLGSGLDLEWRLFNRLPEKYIEAYKFEFEKCRNEFSEESTFKQYEWFYRAHLIVDYISGMTDNYALETYKLLYGIKI